MTDEEYERRAITRYMRGEYLTESETWAVFRALFPRDRAVHEDEERDIAEYVEEMSMGGRTFEY